MGINTNARAVLTEVRNELNSGDESLFKILIGEYPTIEKSVVMGFLRRINNTPGLRDWSKVEQMFDKMIVNGFSSTADSAFKCAVLLFVILYAINPIVGAHDDNAINGKRFQELTVIEKNGLSKINMLIPMGETGILNTNGRTLRHNVIVRCGAGGINIYSVSHYTLDHRNSTSRIIAEDLEELLILFHKAA